MKRHAQHARIPLLSMQILGEKENFTGPSMNEAIGSLSVQFFIRTHMSENLAKQL